jgi:hypothetical protein
MRIGEKPVEMVNGNVDENDDENDPCNVITSSKN